MGLGYPDRGLACAPADTIRRQLVEVVRAVRPHVVVTFDPNGSNLHPDHVAVSRFTSDAVAAAGDGRWFPDLGEVHATPRLLWTLPVRPWEVMRRHDPALEPGADFVLDVSAYADLKAAALKAHRTQHQSLHRIFFSKPDVTRLLGVEMFRQAFGPPLASRPATDVFVDFCPTPTDKECVMRRTLMIKDPASRPARAASARPPERVLMPALALLLVLALVPVAARQVATKPAAQPAPVAAAAQKPDTAPAPAAAPRPMELADIIAWKNVGATAISNDGTWFAYRLSPMEGDSEVFVTEVNGKRFHRFVAGELPSPSVGPGGPGESGPPPSTLRFSEDSKWLALTVYPTRDETARLKRQRRPVQTKVKLLDLTSGKDVTIENVRRFAFAGDRGGWIAFQKAPATSGAPGGGGPPAAAPGAGSAGGRCGQ